MFHTKNLHTYTSHYAPLRSRAIRRLVFLSPNHWNHSNPWRADLFCLIDVDSIVDAWNPNSRCGGRPINKTFAFMKLDGLMMLVAAWMIWHGWRSTGFMIWRVMGAVAGWLCLSANSEFCALQMALSKPSPLVSHWFGRFNNNMYWGMNRLTKWKNDIIQKLLKLWKFYQQILKVVEYLFLSFFCIFLSFGFVIFLSFLFCGVILLLFFCHLVVIFLYFLKPFCCHFCFICLSFSCRFLIQRGWLDPEPSWKVQKRNFTSTRVIFFVIVLSFSCRFLIRIRQAVKVANPV